MGIFAIRSSVNECSLWHRCFSMNRDRMGHSSQHRLNYEKVAVRTVRYGTEASNLRMWKRNNLDFVELEYLTIVWGFTDLDSMRNKQADCRVGEHKTIKEWIEKNEAVWKRASVLWNIRTESEECELKKQGFIEVTVVVKLCYHILIQQSFANIKCQERQRLK